MFSSRWNSLPGSFLVGRFHFLVCLLESTWQILGMLHGHLSWDSSVEIFAPSHIHVLWPESLFTFLLQTLDIAGLQNHCGMQ